MAQNAEDEMTSGFSLKDMRLVAPMEFIIKEKER